MARDGELVCGRIVWVWDAKTRRLLKVFGWEEGTYRYVRTEAYQRESEADDSLWVGLMEPAGEDQDELYDKAVAWVTESRRASISSVQRQFRIGYNRAARLIEELEASPRFANTRFRAPVTQGMSEDVERFYISAEVTP